MSRIGGNALGLPLLFDGSESRVEAVRSTLRTYPPNYGVDLANFSGLMEPGNLHNPVLMAAVIHKCWF